MSKIQVETTSADSSSDCPRPGWFKRLIAKPAKLLGFHKYYNFPLWFIFGGILLGFCIARMPYIGKVGPRDLVPGDWYWFSQPLYKTALFIHLVTILPSGVLAFFQFVPIIRYKAIIIHRISGYIIILCVLTTVGACGILARHSFGGTVEVQGAIYLLGFITSISVIMAYINIKRLQIDQHRNWMLRTWSYMAAIITSRIILMVAGFLVAKTRSFYGVYRCDELKVTDPYAYNLSYVDICKKVGPEGQVSVLALLTQEDTTIAAAGATMRVTFGMCIWLAIALHMIGVEIYFHLTPAETKRLRQASYEKQLKAGMKKPGSAGLTADRFGDAPWEPATSESH